MKAYEAVEAQRRFMPLLPVLARIDGRAFHSFARGLNRPFDERLTRAMINTTKLLVEHTNACMGYTQSDEITLVWLQSDANSQIFFDGRVSKMTSQLAALATLYFYREIVRTLPDYADKMPTFDARVWQVPTLTEATNVFVWREWDATKNSISMAAQSMFSHKELQGKKGNQMQDMMMLQRGVNWNDYPAFFKRGTYVQRKLVQKPFSAVELEKLPAKHGARVNPQLVVNRTVYQELDMPPISKVINRENVVFKGEEPQTLQQETTNVQ